MDNIERLITELHEEGFPARIRSEYTDESEWIVRLVGERDFTLLDRNGELYLAGRGNSLSDALVELNKLCA